MAMAKSSIIIKFKFFHIIYNSYCHFFITILYWRVRCIDLFLCINVSKEIKFILISVVSGSLSQLYHIYVYTSLIGKSQYQPININESEEQTQETNGSKFFCWIKRYVLYWFNFGSDSDMEKSYLRSTLTWFTTVEFGRREMKSKSKSKCFLMYCRIFNCWHYNVKFSGFFLYIQSNYGRIIFQYPLVKSCGLIKLLFY